MPEKLLTIKEASSLLGISERRLKKLIKKGKLPAYKIGGQFLRFRKEQIEDIRRQIPDTFVDRFFDFFYFNDFYIIAVIIIGMILWVIFH